MDNNINDHFNKYFEMIHAISDELKDEAYKLRYQVLCIEYEHLDTKDYPNGMEFDDFDQRSVHYLIRHRKSGDYAATVRLILPDVNNPKELFSLESYCKIDNFAVMRSINRKHIGEVSRFCISKAFKKRKNEGQTLAPPLYDFQNYFTQEERRIFPHFSLALIACVIKASYENDIRYLWGTMESPWLRLLSAFGINFRKIGPKVYYHGERWPAVIKITDMLEMVNKKNPDIYNFITNNGRFLEAKPTEKRVKAG